MNKMTTISTTKAQKIWEKGIAPSKPSVITMGGCNLFQAFAPLENLFDFTHFWRGAIPVIASKQTSISYTQFTDETVVKLLERDSKKIIYQRLKAAPDSIIIFEAAADFTNTYLKIGDSILPDIRNGVFGTEFMNITYKEGSDLATADLLSPDSEYYWDIWKHYFHLIYKELLRERIQGGAPVIFLSRRLCLNELREGEFIPLQNGREIAKRNLMLDDIEEYISQYEDILIIKSSAELLYTSEHAPGGVWEFHPHDGYYADLRFKFIEALAPATGKSQRNLVNWIADADRNLSKARYSCSSLEKELDQARTERVHFAADTEANLNAVRSLCVSLEGELQQERAQRAHLDTEISFLRAEHLNLKVAIEKAANEANSSSASLESELAHMRAERVRLEEEVNLLRAERLRFEVEASSWADERKQHQILLDQAHQATERCQSVCEVLQKELAEKIEIITSQQKAQELLYSTVSDLESQNARLNLLSIFMAGRFNTGKLNLLDRLGRLFALRFEAKQLRKFGFSEREYLQANPDVENAGMVGEIHYLLYGMKEGRKLISTIGIILCGMIMSDFFPSDSFSNGRSSVTSSNFEARR